MVQVVNDQIHVVNDLLQVVNDMIDVVNYIIDVIRDLLQVIDILHVMNDPVTSVLDVSRKMHELRARLEELDAERAGVQQQIAVCMAQLASLAGGQVLPPPDSRLSEQILWALRRYPDRPLAPIDIAACSTFVARES
jgi:hypothetical protein